MSKISVLIVDDHKVLRAGLRSLLDRNSDIQTVGEAENGKRGIALCKELKPNVVLMDLYMPILNGIEATKVISMECHQSRVIILSMFPDHEYVQSALNAGAKGFLVKDTAAGELIQAVRVVHDGKAFFSPSVSKTIVDSMYNDVSNYKAKDLTSREREILQLVAEGNTSKQVAKLLSICRSTVDKHRENIVTKLEIHDVVGLIRYAIKNGGVSAIFLC